jgi:hypothetical protein
MLLSSVEEIMEFMSIRVRASSFVPNVVSLSMQKIGKIIPIGMSVRFVNLIGRMENNYGRYQVHEFYGSAE